MKYFNIPANYNFLLSLYKYILDEFNYDPLNLSNLVVLLPSRRSCNELKKIFLNNSNEIAVLLPTIKAIGDISYDDILLEKMELQVLKKFHEIAKPISNIKYKLLLIREILNNNANLSIEQGVNLAKELNIFLSEVDSEKLSLDNLKTIIDDEFAQHWEKTLQFLEKFGKKWQEFISNNNIISNNNYMFKMIDLHTHIYNTQPPKYPILIAGNLCNIKATFEFVKTLAKYDNCYFVFNGLENVLTSEEFEFITPHHSNYFYNRLIKELEINITNIKEIKYDNYQIIDNQIRDLIYTAMLPADLTYKWNKNTDFLKIKNVNSIKLLECKDEYEEINCICYYLLNYLSTKQNFNLAVITDVEMAKQLENQFKYWNIPFHNAFGNKLIFNELIQFLLLILEVYINNYNPNSLLSLLKHKFVLLGYNKKEFDEIVFLFEENVLRGKNNFNGISSYRNIIKTLDGETQAILTVFLDKIQEVFPSLEDLTLQEFIKKHIEIANNVSCGTIEIQNSICENEFQDINLFMETISTNAENSKVSEILHDFYENVIDFSLKNIREYSQIFKYIISELSYSDEYSQENAVNLISTMESRLINYDLVVVSNVNDGNIPQNIATDPWMSKKMRKNFGLQPKETNIGITNFEFIQYLNQKEVLLTRAIKKNNQPTIKSRFLLRLETFLLINHITLDNCQNVLNVSRETISKINRVKITRPQPIIDVKLRPKKLSATNISGNLLKNPYDIYCKYILNLYPKDEINLLDKSRVFGLAIHEIVEEYCKNYNNINKNDKNDFIINLGKEILKQYFNDDTVTIMLFFDKFVEIAKLFILEDEKIRQEGYQIFAEQFGECKIKDFMITAKADRIEVGSDVNIIDYKTGTVPSIKTVIEGQSLQLPIEIFILKNSGFKNIPQKNIGTIKYWKLKDNQITSVKSEEINLLLENVETLLINIINFFQKENTAYIATLKNKEYSNYTHLSRINEWLFNE